MEWIKSKKMKNWDRRGCQCATVPKLFIIFILFICVFVSQSCTVFGCLVTSAVQNWFGIDQLVILRHYLKMSLWFHHKDVAFVTQQNETTRTERGGFVDSQRTGKNGLIFGIDVTSSLLIRLRRLGRPQTKSHTDTSKEELRHCNKIACTVSGFQK